VVWDRREAIEGRAGVHVTNDLFADLLEKAPLAVLLLDASRRVIAANEAARSFFEIDMAKLPASLVEVTLESRLLDVVGGDESEHEVQLVHHRRTVLAKVVPARRQSETLLFVSDITELRHLARVRQEFVANLVHELKTPLTSLRLTAESLLGDPLPKDRRRFAERVVREADLVSKIIDNLRQLGDIEAGVFALEITNFELAELIDDSLTRLALEREIHVDAERGLYISTDRTKLAQALGNVLDNAAKFSPPGTPIDLTAGVAHDEVVISVRDRGPGISPEHWSRVFERFYKIDRARPREAGGFGLGLAITKHLVQALGGRIWTEAARDGGQIFSIALPSQVLTGG
jgi:two-component system, OmpR family, phosphate regulon sensor histidine kinase PhoR